MRCSPFALLIAPHVRQRRRQRYRRLRELGFASYDAYLKAPHWQTVKARYRASPLPWQCMCGEKEGLDLHHKTYDHLGDEAPEDLVPLCRRCHRMVHELDQRAEIGIDLAGLADPVRAAQYAPAREQRLETARRDFIADDAKRKTLARHLSERVRRGIINRTFSDELVDEIERRVAEAGY